MAQTPKLSKLQRYHDYLTVDRDDLDTCLAEQPEVFYHVADAHVETVARRDAIKLELEEAIAELDGAIRAQALASKSKITETAIENRIKLAPRVKALQRELLTEQTEVNKWIALKDAFRQRNDVLQELARLYLSRLGGGAVGAAREDIAAANRMKIAAARAVEGDPRRRSREEQ